MPIGTTIITWLVLAVDILIVLYLLESLAITVKIKQKRSHIWHIFGKNAKVWAFLVALVAMLGSLYFSDYLGYEPCKLCWYQRIFMYPQVFLFGLALIKKDSRIWSYSILLSVIGALIAAFHYISQVTKTSILPCDALGYSASCSQTFVLSFGYITIPMMALSAFVAIIILAHLRKKETHYHAN